ncbi:DUF4012 domain-containing protein [Candidatus Falkowbacteria bacterium]|nr:DUF4012 domain-containing protein [Candidatus Falkowbacteria bacterium]
MEKLDEFLSDIHLKKKKTGSGIFWKIFKIILALVLVFAIIALILAFLAFFKFKNIYDSAILGKASLEYSLSNARRGDFAEMIEAAIRAEGYFNDILAELEANTDNIFLRSSGFTGQQISDLRYLAESASIVSRSMSQAGEIAKEIDDVMAGRLGESFSEFTTAEKRSLLKTIYESGPELNGLKANLELALLNLDRVKANVLFLPVRGKIDEVKVQLEKGVETLSKLVLASQLAPELAGYPEPSTFLVLFQNSSELRATGGFIGTYGILEMDSGDIVRFDTHDIYHMDMPMESLGLLDVDPPLPIKKYLNPNWYMRDSNWSPDWPTSARQIDWFYHQENSCLPEANKINDFNGNFSGIVAVTPKLVEDLLAVIGPVEAQGEDFSQDNFLDLLEYKVEQDFVNQNISAWQRKEIIGHLLEEIKMNILDLDYRRWPEVASVADKSMEQKDVQVFFHNESLQSLAKELGIAGEVKAVAGDYLLAVDSNMAALKTDIAMERSLEYLIEEKEDKVIGKLTLNYKNNGKYDWRTGDYHTYTRVYVPEGSKLIKAEGISRGQVETGNELGKTYFAGFKSIKVGTAGSLYFEYELPDSIKDDIKTGEYRLYVQKQPGKDLKGLKVDFRAVGDVKSYNLKEQAETPDNSRVMWGTDLDTDKEFQIIF